MQLTGRVIKFGTAEGVALVSPEPIGFFGGVDPETGVVVEAGHPLAGECVAGRVLVFPTGKGSTVGSYTLYRLARAGTAPAAIVNAESEAIVAVGAIIGEIPMVDQVDITRIEMGDWVRIEGDRVLVRDAKADQLHPTRLQSPISNLQSPISNLVFVKLGGSVITDKTRPETAQPEVIARLAEEVQHALTARPELRLVLGHGSGSFGHIPARRYGTRQGVRSAADWRGFAEVADVAVRLTRIVTGIFMAAGVPVWSLQPSASARCRGGKLISLATAVVEGALVHGLAPLVHGDVALDEAQGGTIISTEQIFAYLAPRLHPARLILVGVVDGVFEGDPLRDPSARLVPEISAANWESMRAALGGSYATDVTGGMLAKVEEMVNLVRELPGLTVHIISGERPGALETLLLRPTDAVGGTVIRDS